MNNWKPSITYAEVIQLIEKAGGLNAFRLAVREHCKSHAAMTFKEEGDDIFIVYTSGGEIYLQARVPSCARIDGPLFSRSLVLIHIGLQVIGKGESQVSEWPYRMCVEGEFNAWVENWQRVPTLFTHNLLSVKS